ncbi:hypothetical protein GCM10009754_73900 [Amycolatopsis minnesotensis]|uniref:Uncharacterized protein n=1 Tax=Amycolatopsis minnesotensis TaxID=337894 RepID=A0ABN2SG88_9PSEU
MSGVHGDLAFTFDDFAPEVSVTPEVLELRFPGRAIGDMGTYWNLPWDVLDEALEVLARARRHRPDEDD